MVREIFIEWMINLINVLIYILIFYRAIGTTYFNTFDLIAALLGIIPGILFMIIKVMGDKE